MKRTVMALLIAVLLLLACGSALAAESRIPPAYPVPEYVTWLLEVAAGELGYREGDHGYTKYGEWAGNPYAQWCAEYLCWCVDQVDQQHGTDLLNRVFPLYSGSNTGRSWFISHGRYVVRWGNLDGWGYQWLKGTDSFLTTGDYIPQPGDWVFFTWTDTLDTDHVAMVEYCTRDEQGNVTIHCLEGNTPAMVKRASYDLHYSRILGYGTVHDVADWTMRSGNSGPKVRAFQERLIRLGYLWEGQADGVYGPATIDAVKAFQTAHGIKVNGIANITTQRTIDRLLWDMEVNDLSAWAVTGPDEEDISLDSVMSLDELMARYGSPEPSRRDDVEELYLHPKEDEEELEFLPDELARAYVELKEYFDSNRAGFDINVVFNTGTPFQKKVWNALNSIPYGGTASYEDIALRLTDGKLSEARKITRAVGSACSDNPVAVIVPCHRVIGKDGSIVGYSAGIDIKDYLLLHESFTAVTPLISKEV